MSRIHPPRPARAPLQAAEHVEQCGGDLRRRRDRTGAGVAGEGLRCTGFARHEPGAAQAADRRGLPGGGAGRGPGQCRREGVLPAQVQVAPVHPRVVRTAGSARGPDSGGRRGQRGGGESARRRRGQHGVRRGRRRAGRAGGRHRSGRGHRKPRRDHGPAVPFRTRPRHRLHHQSVPRRRSAVRLRNRCHRPQDRTSVSGSRPLVPTGEPTAGRGLGVGGPQHRGSTGCGAQGCGPGVLADRQLRRPGSAGRGARCGGAVRGTRPRSARRCRPGGPAGLEGDHR